MIKARKTASKKLLQRAAISPVWCIFFPRWKSVTPINHGTISRPAKPTCSPIPANACITIFISSTRNSASVICGFPLGRRFVCNFTLTLTTGWRVAFVAKESNSPWSIMLSSTWRTGQLLKNWLMNSALVSCTRPWIDSRSNTAPSASTSDSNIIGA